MHAHAFRPIARVCVTTQVVEVKKSFVGALVRIQAEARAEVGRGAHCWRKGVVATAGSSSLSFAASATAFTAAWRVAVQLSKNRQQTIASDAKRRAAGSDTPAVAPLTLLLVSELWAWVLC
jgi:hypothetical protein